MPKVKFTKAMTFKKSDDTSVFYPAGFEGEVSGAVAKQAKETGRGDVVKTAQGKKDASGES